MFRVFAVDSLIMFEFAVDYAHWMGVPGFKLRTVPIEVTNLALKIPVLPVLIGPETGISCCRNCGFRQFN